MKNHPLRTLARSSFYQNLYARSKEMGSIHLFENTNDFSKIQHEFLFWIALYHRLYQDLVMNEKYLTEDVIENDLRCDCYLIWEERVKRKKELNKIKNNKNPKSSPKKQVDYTSPTPSVVFR